jgi:hypothetical protein
MPGLVPGIHVFTARKKNVDGQDKPGHDGGKTRPQIVDKTRRISGQALRMGGRSAAMHNAHNKKRAGSPRAFFWAV